MDLLGVQAFLAIVQTGSLNKAAVELHLSQGAVSYRLKMLEQELGARLLERAKGVQRVRLTPTGEKFVNLAERWNLLRQETQILQAMGPQPSLFIGAADSLNLYVLPPLYRALGRHLPSIRLQIRTQHTQESFESVERKEVDVAFVVRDMVVPSVAVEPFFSEEMVLLRQAAPERMIMDTIDIHSLQAENELYMNWSTGYQVWHDRWWDPLCPSRIRLDTAGLISILLQDAAQWAIVPLTVGSSLAESSRFVVQRLSTSAPERVCYKVTHKYPNESTRQSLRILEDYLQIFYREHNSGLERE
ncbi:MAG: LysR family transcriptional regulator [Negativicutes bacterium]|nr:LysR family transcriptional regulator [Negativicutes bacterium]